MIGRMNIDLLTSADGQAALLLDRGFGNGRRVIAIGLDRGELVLEALFEKDGRMAFNIPLQADSAQRLVSTQFVYLALAAGEEIAHLKQVPFLQDAAGKPQSPRGEMSVLRFAHFLSLPLAGQPVHRENAADETSARSLAGPIARGDVTLSAALEDKRKLELAAAPALDYERYGPKPKWIGGRAKSSARRHAPRQTHRKKD